MIRWIRRIFWLPTIPLAAMGFTVFIVAAAFLMLAWTCSYIAEDENE